jgi:sulfur carrier protein
LQILLNGEAHTTEAADLGKLCVSLGLAEAKIATALNGNFVPAERREATPLTDGDAIEIVAPRQGG